MHLTDHNIDHSSLPQNDYVDSESGEHEQRSDRK